MAPSALYAMLAIAIQVYFMFVNKKVKQDKQSSQVILYLLYSNILARPFFGILCLKQHQILFLLYLHLNKKRCNADLFIFLSFYKSQDLTKIRVHVTNTFLRPELSVIFLNNKYFPSKNI